MSVKLPPEWAPQSAIALVWPHANTDWADDLTAAEQAYIEFSRQITRYQRLVVVCYDTAHRAHVQQLLSNANISQHRVVLTTAPSDDTWLRDTGPLTALVDNKPLLLDFQFNGWGNRYEYALDNRITRTLYEQGIFPNVQIESDDLVLEGGSIETDGEGTLLTTSRCLLAGTRNPAMDRDDMQAKLTVRFGIKRILWLESGYLAGDDTDGHIDNLARFCNPWTIAYTACNDANDEHYVPLKAMHEELTTFRDDQDNPYTLVALPIPAAVYNSDGQRLPASYANFLIINGAVLVPVFKDPADQIALDRLQSIFTDREVSGIDCRHIVKQYGGLHCLSMQLPAGVLSTQCANLHK